MFSFFFLLQTGQSKLHDSLTTVFTRNSSILHWQCTSPSLFHNFEVLRGTWNYPVKNYGFIYNATFFTCTHVHKALSWQTVSRKGEQFSLPCSYDPSQAGKSFIWKRDLVIPQDVKEQLTLQQKLFLITCLQVLNYNIFLTVSIIYFVLHKGSVIFHIHFVSRSIYQHHEH